MTRYKVYTVEKGIVETDDYDDVEFLTWHREDGPAFIKYYNNGIVEYEEYYVNDRKHRLDGPAYIEYNMNGSIKRESYYINGCHYTKGNYNIPRYKVYTVEKGIVETDDYDDVEFLTWHREDGPAFIVYYDNGEVAYEEYYVHDKCHRLDGPAYIEYNMNGSIERESYYINGIEYTKKDYYKELLKLNVQSL